MKLDRGELKREARQALAGAWPEGWKVTLVFLLLTTGVSLALERLTGASWRELAALLRQGLETDYALPLVLRRMGPVRLFLTILVPLYNTVMTYGYRVWGLRALRGNGDWSDLAEGFGIAWRVLLQRLLLGLYAVVWSLVFLIPSVFLAALIPVPGAAFLFPIAGVCAAALYLTRYLPASWCMMDDEKHSVLRSLRASVAMTRGRAWELAVLLLSFAGWMVLTEGASQVVHTLLLLATGGVPALTGAAGGGEVPFWIEAVAEVCAWPLRLWVTPYFTLTLCAWYDRARPAGVPVGAAGAAENEETD